MRGWFRVIWTVLNVSGNPFPAILVTPLCVPPLAFECSATSAAVPSCSRFFPIPAFPAAPNPRIVLASEADRPDTLAAGVAKLRDIKAMLGQDLV